MKNKMLQFVYKENREFNNKLNDMFGAKKT